MAIFVQEHVPLRELTTLKVGGTARFFCSVSTEQNLKTAFRFARKKKLPIIVLGGGSNVLLSDGELNAVVVKNEIRGVEWESPLINGALPTPPARGGVSSLRDGVVGAAGGLLQPPAHRNASAPKVSGDTVLVISGAGEGWDALVAEAVKRCLWGIENLSGIPGTVGAAPIQNIGAYGVEIKDVLEWVEALDTKTGKVRRISNHKCFFGYRDSIFKTPKGKSLIVTRVALRLFRHGKPNLTYKDLQNYFAPSYSPFPKGSTPILIGGRDLNPPPRKTSAPPFEKEELRPSLPPIRRAVLDIRSQKFPDLRTHGTAGSFFKNPIIPKEQFDALKKRYPDLPGFAVHGTGRNEANTEQTRNIKIPLAWILDKICGLKGYRMGNVALFERQPIVLVATLGATAEEIRKFSEEITKRVKEKTGIEIQNEVASIGLNRSHPALDAGSSPDPVSGTGRLGKSQPDAGSSCFVYILASKPYGTLYVGMSADLKRRAQKHKAGSLEGFTKKYGVKMLVYYEQVSDSDTARRREQQLKRWRRKWKFDLIEQKNPEWKDLYDVL